MPAAICTRPHHRIWLLLLVLGPLAWPAPSAQANNFNDFKGLWVTRFDYRNGGPSTVRNIVNQAADLGITDVIFQVRGEADAYYDSLVEPRAERLSGTSWDPLQVAIDAAHARGVKLHAWVNVNTLWSTTTPPRTDTDILHPFHHTDPSFRVFDPSGEPEPLNPSFVQANSILPEWHEHVQNVAADIVSRYDVDGLHLDRIRWLGDTDWASLPHDERSRALFEAATGLDASSPRNGDAYRGFVRDRITDLVAGIHDTVKTVNADVALSAAVWRDPDVGANDVLQDYRAWLERDLLDIAMPMIYLSPSNDHLFAPNLANVLDIETNAKIAPGIGVFLHDEANGGPEFTVEQLQRLYDAETDGATLFAYSSFFRSGSLGVARQDAVKQFYESLLIPGDFDGDGAVDAFDLGIWQNGFGITSGATLADGDANGDGAVDAFDLAVWQLNFKGDVDVFSVPEPATAAMLVLATPWLMRRRARRPQAHQPGF